jgi:aerobic-type carbon monoxide dehydrogenase small subunit (CoxS/CutS family)
MACAPLLRTLRAVVEAGNLGRPMPDPQSPIPDTRSVGLNAEVNGRKYRCHVEPRLLLSDFLRHDLGLTGTHVGCEHGVCGACTILLDGEAVRSCLMLAVQAEGHALTTVEGLTPGGDTTLHPLQEAFREAHGLQCGFCTPGILMTLIPFLREHPSPNEDEIRHVLSGNLCRCTGYHNIVAAARLAAARMSPTAS